MKDNQSIAKTMPILFEKSAISSVLPNQALRELNHWLKKTVGKTVFEIHGFLSAVLCSPVQIKLSALLPAMLVPNLPELMTEEEMCLYLDRIMVLGDDIADTLVHEEVLYPWVDFHPVFPFTAQSLSAAQYDHLKRWCQGYLRCVDLAIDAWETLKDSDNLFFILNTLANQHPSAQSLGIANDSKTSISEEKINKIIADMIDALPVLLGMIYDQACLTANYPKTDKSSKTDINRLKSEKIDSMTLANLFYSHC